MGELRQAGAEEERAAHGAAALLLGLLQVVGGGLVGGVGVDADPTR